ncbi:hypothetical protein IRZ70_04715 [Pseudomonas monteilii]|nr:hypothetical protein [Pseudomonas monteilii]
MNDSADNVRVYFEQRQMLLERLGGGIVRDASLPQRALDPHHRMPSYRRQWVTLGEEGSEWRIQISGRDLDDLDRLGVGLLYFHEGTDPVVSYLHGRFDRRSLLPSAVLEGLMQHSGSEEGQTIWLAAPHDPLHRMYMFFAVRCDDYKGWLGIELRARDVMRALTSNFSGAYALLDQARRVVLGHALPKLNELNACISYDGAFGFCGNSTPPQYLFLTKALGPSEWRQSYYLSLRQLLSPYSSAFLGCLVFWGGLSLAVVIVARRFENRLIKPARMQLSDLLQHDEFLRTTLEVAPIALCLLRCSDGRVLLENHLARQWFGKNVERVKENSRWIEFARASSSDTSTVEVQGSNGGVLQLNLIASTYKGEEVLFCACSDISSKKQAEQALREIQELFAMTCESNRAFLRAMSREVQVPLYQIEGSLECAQSELLDQQQLNRLASIQRTVNHLQNLLNDIQNVSQLEQGGVILDQREFSPSCLLRDIAQSHAPAAHRKGVDLYICCAPDIPDTLRGDPTLIRKVLNKLIHNSLKFTDDGFVVLRIRVMREGGERKVVWQVSDTGCGIAVKEQAELFKPFFQVDRKVRELEGSGLGLTICQRLVQLLGGRLEVVSERGLGSSFSMYLPLQCPAGKAEVSVLRLSTIPVYVRCRPGDLRDTLFSRLQLCGAQPRLWQAGQVADAVLLECMLLGDRPLPELAWQGPRVIADAKETNRLEVKDGTSTWLINLYDLRAIEKAIKAAQDQVIPGDSNCYSHSSENAL